MAQRKLKAPTTRSSEGDFGWSGRRVGSTVSRKLRVRSV
jgi:hypothetical protein